MKEICENFMRIIEKCSGSSDSSENHSRGNGQFYVFFLIFVGKKFIVLTDIKLKFQRMCIWLVHNKYCWFKYLNLGPILCCRRRLYLQWVHQVVRVEYIVSHPVFLQPVPTVWGILLWFGEYFPGYAVT